MDRCTISERQGLSLNNICKLLQISVKRIQRWRLRLSLKDSKPGPTKALHALLTKEKEAILLMACDNTFVDDSHRILAAKGADYDLFHVSASTVYNIMREKGLTTARTDNVYKGGRSKSPVRTEIDGPNQRWCWDISYLPTTVKGQFLYLFCLLDEYSRKIVAWRISWNMTYKEGIELLHEGLENEKLDDILVSLPDLVNDRGTQMKAKPFMAMCTSLGINQLFSRPKTPNDNPFIESFFSLVKNDSKYPGYFTDDINAIAYFTYWISYYNNDRLHGGIQFVTPIQRHDKLDLIILKRRLKKHSEALKNRIRFNKKNYNKSKVALEVCRV